MSKTLRELFVDRMRQGDIFRRMLAGETRRRVMVITAGAGLGKSWLIRLLAAEAADRQVPLAQIDFADGQAYDALALVRRCRDALGSENFNALTAAINEATTARVALTTPGAPAAGPINIGIGNENVLTSSSINISEVGSTIVRDNSFVIQTDNPLLRQAIEDRINAAFFESLVELCAKTRVVFLFDTYERASLENERWVSSAADRWVIGQLLARMRDGKLENAVVVLAGRQAPEFGVEWNEVLGRTSLDLLECDFVAEYLRMRRGLADLSDGEVKVVCDGTGGNPQVMGLFADNLEQKRRPKVDDDDW
jgi:hypothetical protein